MFPIHSSVFAVVLFHHLGGSLRSGRPAGLTRHAARTFRKAALGFDLARRSLILVGLPGSEGRRHAAVAELVYARAGQVGEALELCLVILKFAKLPSALVRIVRSIMTRLQITSNYLLVPNFSCYPLSAWRSNSLPGMTSNVSQTSVKRHFC